MPTQDYLSLTNEEITTIAKKFGSSELAQEIGKMLPSQVSLIVHLVNERNDPAWRSKIGSIFSNLKDRHALEAIGNACTWLQFSEILNVSTGSQEDLKKLDQVLIGVLPEVFRMMLLMTSEVQMEILKRETLSEPIQFQLTTLIHHYSKENAFRLNELQSLQKNISQIISETMTWKEFYAWQSKFGILSENMNKSVETLNKALILAWNTPNRPDLIDKLTMVKEEILRSYHFNLGHSGNDNEPPTGIYESYERQLSLVFEKKDGSLTLSDDVLAGLACFSLWTVEDYITIGLLSEEEASISKESLLNKVRDRLYTYGLKDIASLKRAHIYSKYMLEDYIRLKEQQK